MKADPKAEAAPATNSKKKFLVIGLAAVLAIGAGGGAAWFFTRSKPEAGKEEHKEAAHAEKAIYIVVDQFTVNLQPENGQDQYLQLQFSLQVGDEKQETLIKDNMAKVRSRVLLLLSGKKASEISTVEGKNQLAKDIAAEVRKPFVDKGPPQEVTDVLFTSFIIQ